MMRDIPIATVTDLRRNTEALLEKAEHQPVLITRYGKPAFVLMSTDHYQVLANTQAEAP